MADDFKAEVEFAKVNVDENTVSWLCFSIDSALKAYLWNVMIIIYRCPVVEASDCKMNCSSAASELTKKGIQ